LRTDLLFSLKRSLLVVLLLALRDRGLLVLLVLGDKIVHVGLGLGELHLVHALTSVPVKESLTPEHGSELVTDTLEQLLDGGAVADESGGHLQATGRDVTERGHDVVGDPLNEVGGILVLDVADLVLNLLHGDLSAVDGGASEVATVAEVGSSHHVLRVEDLLSKLRHGNGAEAVGTARGERSESDHEEVKTREGNHVDGELAEIAVELTRETQASGHTGHDGRDEVVEVTVAGVGELEGAHADVVEGLVVNAEGLVGVLDKLVDGEGGVVGLDNGVGNLGGRHDGEGGHHAVGELLTDLADEKRTHTGTSTTTERMGDLEALKAVAALSLTTDDVEDLVDKLGTLGVVTLGPVVSGTRLSEDEVVGPEELTERSSADSIHGTGLQIDEDGTRNVLVAGSLEVCGQFGRLSTCKCCCLENSYLVEVDVHALELKVRRAVVPVRRQMVYCAFYYPL
jgi:hypothetical protein